MTQISPIGSVLFALMHTGLLLGFMRPAPERSVLSRCGIVAGTFLLQVFVRYIEPMSDVASYVSLLGIISVSFISLLLWTGQNWRAVFQQTTCNVLLTECVTMVLCHLSQKLFGLDIFRSEPLLRMLLSRILMTAVDYILIKLLLRSIPQETMVYKGNMSFLLLSAIPFLFSWRVTAWLPIEPEAVPLSLSVMLIASCFLFLALTISMQKRLYAEQEKRVAEQQQYVMQLKQQQFVMRRNSIDQVRKQYHDMKNLLLYLEKKPSNENFRAHLSKILDDIHPVEYHLDTGCDVLDILVSEKLGFCEKNGIVCTVIADGSIFSHIAPLDMVTIIGNAMDNAIEACLRIPEKQRFIEIRTAQPAGFSVLRFANSCDGHLFEENGAVRTRKTDEENHGFGLANIRSVIESYHGEMNWQMEDNEFTLTILFPAKQSTHQ